MKTLLKAAGIVILGLLVAVGATMLGSRWIFGPIGPFPGNNRLLARLVRLHRGIGTPADELPGSDEGAAETRIRSRP